MPFYDDANRTKLREAGWHSRGYLPHFDGRQGQFWIEEYFDCYIRNQEHFERTVKYIENNPVKAGLCRTPEHWPYSSAWFRKHKDNDV
jgi:REP element-mobilizing transposase RayT